MPLPTQQRLNDLLVRWNQEILEFRAARDRYGETRADLKYRRAVVALKAKEHDKRIAVSLLALIADADPEVHQLDLDHEAAGAAIDAGKERLRWCSAVSDGLRSEISTERSEAQLYSEKSEG